MALKRITEEEMNAQGVIAAPDILNGTPAQNKAIFDRMVRSLVAPAVNACVEAVDEVNANQEEWDKQEQTRETNEGNRETKEVRREEAEATRETNEAARKQAEVNRSLAEGQRVEAEAKRVGAESERRSEFTAMSGAETRRAEAETLRSQSEKNRESAESYRELAEASRVQAEAGRTSREQTRETNEKDRKTAEVQREEAESVREANETARKRAEVNRADAEAGRVAAEQERVDTNNGIVAQATEAAKQAEQSAADAAYNAENAGKPPYIGENGNWFVWDMTTAAFVDSGEKAEGVTVSSVNESTEDGGSNVVTFSDGKKLAVKNGKQGGKGDPGYTPVRGKDYWTPNDKTEILQEVLEGLGTPIVGTVDENNNIVLGGDLADGEYTLKYLNQGEYIEIGKLAISSGSVDVPPDTTLNWSPGVKIDSSTGAETTGNAGYSASDYIAVVSGYTYTVTKNTTRAEACKVCYYDADKNFISTSADVIAQTENPTSATIPLIAGAAYFRLRLYGTAAALADGDYMLTATKE